MKRDKFDAKDLLDIMQAVGSYTHVFLNAYCTEEDKAAKAGLGRRLEELQDLFRRAHNMRLGMEEKARRETEAPPPGGETGQGLRKESGMAT